MGTSDLPFGSEFSPSQIDLIRVLEIAEGHSGDWRALEDSIRREYFDSHTTSEYNRRKLANNCKLGMIAYGVLNRDGSLTDFGKELLSFKRTPEKMYEFFARHILLNLKGLIVLQTVQDMHARGERVDLIKLREWLQERGIHFPRGGKHPSIMRLWLEKAGIVTSDDWQIDIKRLEEIIGTSSNTIDELSIFSIEQKAFLKTLANLGEDRPYWSNEVEKLANTTYGVKFDEKNLPKTVLYSLEKAGYISLERGTKKSGRGAKPFKVRLTDKIRSDLIIPLIDCLQSQAHTDLRPMLRKPLNEILKELSSSDRHIKGLALEALAFYLMRLIDLKYVATRLRGEVTGGAEVDLIFEGARLIFSRWQIQCKNTKVVSLDDVAKEVGLTFQLKSNVVMVVSTGSIGSEARKYAHQVMSTTNLNVILLDSNDLQKIANNPTYIADALNREAKRAMEVKKLEMI
jgi:site-specific DNA-methyltransferase (cytosine-N4-specific)